MAYLLLNGALPNSSQYQKFLEELKGGRSLPPRLRTVLEQLPSTTHPMYVLRTAVSALGCMEPESNERQGVKVATRLLAILPTCLLYWYQFAHHGHRIEEESGATDIASHFLTLLHPGYKIDETSVLALNTTLILYAEHEFNASTFAARVTTGTAADIYSAVTTAIGTLSGPLHGGANEEAMELIASMSNAAEVPDRIRKMLAAKEKIMGFGHRVYKQHDPRSDIVKELVQRFAQEKGRAQQFEIAQAIEQTMLQEKKLYPNVDFYAGLLYHFLDIPSGLFTPIFVLSRVSGWCAHILEQRADNRLIRPVAEYVGPTMQPFIALADRK